MVTTEYLPRDRETGKLEKYGWPGGYGILYITERGDYLCADCANKEEAKTYDDGTPAGDKIVGCWSESEMEETHRCEDCEKIFGEVE